MAAKRARHGAWTELSSASNCGRTANRMRYDQADRYRRDLAVKVIDNGPRTTAP